MIETLLLEKAVSDGQIFKGTFPGVYDFNRLVENNTDGYSREGELLFKFRKGVVPNKVNDDFPSLADICKRKVSLRTDASGHQVYEQSRLLGYDLNIRTNNCVAETSFTKDQHRDFKKWIYLIEIINDIYRTEFPGAYYFQEKLAVDPHFLIGTTVFSQCIVNKSFRTCLHRDRGNVDNTMSNLICLGDNSFSGGYLVFPEYRVAINLRPRDYLGFLGKELWHGNTEITGKGTRLSVICYSKKEIVGKKYVEELSKLANKMRARELNSVLS